MSDLLNRDARRRSPARASRASARRNGPTPAQSRMLVEVAFKIPGVVIASVAALVLVTLVSVNSELTGTFGAIAGIWFAIHQVPLTIAGTSLAVFPLLPTLILMLVSARAVARAASEHTSNRETAWIAGAAIGGPILVTAVALAVAKDASAVIGLSSPHALVAFGWVAAIHAVSVGVGLAVCRWDSAEFLGRIPDWLRAVVVPAVRASMALVAGGAVVLVLALLMSWSTVETLIESGRDFVGMLGLTVLSILYLPNVLVGTLAVVTGSAGHVGVATAGLFEVTGGPLPPLPILAVFPEGPTKPVWLAMLVVPVVAGFLLGRDCARRSVDIQIALQSVWAAAAGVGIVAAAIGVAAGGNLGTFGTVEVTVWSFALLTFAWLAVVGSLTTALFVWRRQPEEPAPAPKASPLEEPVAHPELALDAEVVEEGTALGRGADGDVLDAEVVETVPENSSESDDESDVAEPRTAPGSHAESTAAADAPSEPLDAEVVETADASDKDLPESSTDRND